MLGVGLLVLEQLPDVQVEAILPGRLQVCRVRGYRVLNIYAPAGTNRNDQRKRFFSQSVLAEVRKEKCIMVGD